MPKFPQDGRPKQVRAYLAEVLIEKHDVAPEDAHSTADLWKLGRGSDLYNCSKQDFAQIFGKDVGPFLYTSVGEDKYADWRASRSGIINYWAIVLACGASVIFLRQVCYFEWNAQAKKNTGCASLACGLPLMICGIRELSVRESSLALAVLGGLVLIIVGISFIVNFLVEEIPV